jgi:ABC-type oligopeptide transport system substrate-binding subunit
VRVLTALIALLAALALAACGSAGTDSSGDFEGEQREVASAVEDLQSAAADDDASEICRTLLAKSLVDRLGAGDGCEKAVAAALDATDTDELDVERVTVNGTNATARVKSGSGDGATTRDVRLTREGRNWKIASL